jgi:hypothetical protein
LPCPAAISLLSRWRRTLWRSGDFFGCVYLDPEVVQDRALPSFAGEQDQLEAGLFDDKDDVIGALLGWRHSEQLLVEND